MCLCVCVCVCARVCVCVHVCTCFRTLPIHWYSYTDLDSASVHPLSHVANFSAPLFGRAQTTLPLSASVLHKTRTHGYHFQWFNREGKPLISNGRIRLLHSNTTIVICSVFSADYGIYHVVVSNNTGSPIFTIRISLNNIVGSVPDKRVGEEDRLWIVAVVLAVLIVLVVIGELSCSNKHALCRLEMHSSSLWH